MMSPSSGYITVRGNVSDDKIIPLLRSLCVPRAHVVIVSFKELVPIRSGVELYRRYQTYDHSLGQCTDHYDVIWLRTDPNSNFAHVFNFSEIILSAFSFTCVNTSCFQLWFSFLPDNSTFQTTPSGLWNCSVDHYSYVRHHLACNLKTECEDGRDETEDCPFSSHECQGVVALCNHCYKFVKFPPVADIKQGREYCQLLGGSLGFPKWCKDWYRKLRIMTGIHPGMLQHLLVDLSINDISLPDLYRYVITVDRTVHYHSVQFSWHIKTAGKKCLAMEFEPESPKLLSHDFVRAFLKPHVCTVKSDTFGVVCEFKGNDTKNRDQRKSIFLSTEFVMPTGQQVVEVCDDGHVTYTVFLCGSKQYKACGQQQTLSTASEQLFCSFGSKHQHIFTPLFACQDEIITVSFSLVCDFSDDCQDNSDESFCQHPVCLKSFTCGTGQCLSYDQLCDQTPHCQDESDEQSCDALQTVSIDIIHFPSPALINFDGVRQFVSVPMESNESCPDSHYRCPGEFNDCLPVFTRCNGVYDCLDHQDEERCEEMTCQGFFRCRASTTCIHSDHMCDSWPHCPMHDDELLCGVTCPVTCMCQGHTFLCHQPFAAALFSQLRYLDATGSGMTLSDVSNNTYLIHLVLHQCNLTTLPETGLLNVRALDLQDNKLQRVNLTSLVGLENLRVFLLSHNPLTSLIPSGVQQRVLTEVHLSFTSLTVFDAEVFSSFPGIRILNLSFASVHRINTNGFQSMSQLTELDMDGNPLEIFPIDLFQELTRLSIISAENYKLCCRKILPHNFNNILCYAPKDEISSCEDLLQSWTYRAFLWLVAILSLTGNAFCICVRFFAKSVASTSAFSVLVSNLTIADLLMGVYNTIIGVADVRYRGIYLQYDDAWKGSATCKAAGSLSLLSSEVSAGIIWLITLDRFVALRFPLSTMRFERMSGLVACLLTWLVGWCLALLPLLPLTSHWEFYSQTGICIPLPVTRHQFKGKEYSFSVLIVFNFILFLMVSGGQLFIYWSIQKNSLKTSSTKMSQDITIARRLITVAVTDFVCWFPIALCGILARADVPIPGEINVALAVFVLPLNSAVNPFLYTFNRLSEKLEKSKETKILTWLESHPELVVC